MDLIRELCPELTCPWGAFASVTINGGRRTSSKHHTDQANYSGGFCGVVPVRDFDPTRSARLCFQVGDTVFESELPPGVVQFIPSALFTHWNTGMADGDVRSSLIFWMPGALVRFYQAYQLFQKMNIKDLNAQERAEWKAKQADRLAELLARYPLFGDDDDEASG